jgi:type II secretion system protein G
MKRLKEERGFTLIELIVVITILGILVALVVPSVAGYTDRAKVKATLADGKNLQTALLLYRAEKGDYPEPATGNTTAKWTKLRQDLQDYIALPATPSNYTFQDYTLTDGFTVTLKAKDKNTTTVTIKPSEVTEGQ